MGRFLSRLRKGRRDVASEDFLGESTAELGPGSREPIVKLPGIPPKTTIGGLKSAMGGIFTLWKMTNATNEACVFLSQRFHW